MKRWFSLILLSLVCVSLAGAAQSSSSEGPLGDYGDAPDGLSANYEYNFNPERPGYFPTEFRVDQAGTEIDYVLHRFPEEQVFLGQMVTSERNGLQVDRDLDDAWEPASFLTCNTAAIDLFVTVPEAASAESFYLNALFDWSHDGAWSNAETCDFAEGQSRVEEWGIRNLALHEAPYNLEPGFQGEITLPSVPTGAVPGELWIRFTVTTEPVDESRFAPVSQGGLGWHGQGDFQYGETEDYFTCLLFDEDKPLPGCPVALASQQPIDPPPGSAVPNAEDDASSTSAATPVDVEVLINDSDPNNQTLIVTGTTQASNGTVSVNPDGTVEYTPDDGFTGDDQFNYTICNEDGACDTALVVITVVQGNTPPVAGDDDATTDEGSPVNVSVLDNDIDPDGDDIAVVDNTDPDNGTVECSEIACTYTPDDGFIGTDTFTYTISDGNGGTSTATVTVVVNDISAEISLTKTADPTGVPEPGGQVTFSVQIRNDSETDAVTIDSLVDDVHGNLDGQGDCSVPQTIGIGAAYECAFSAFVSGNAGEAETDTITAQGTDDDGNPISTSDDATVQITDVSSAGINVIKTANPTRIDEPGGDVTFTVRVENPSGVDSVTINSLTDDIHGDLDGQGSCSVPQEIAPGGFYQCGFTAEVTGNADDTETDTVTASGQDDDGAPVSDSDTATVTINGVPPGGITVTKTADPTSLPEPGGGVTFTVRIDNPSVADTVTINSLVDDIHGDLNGQGSCSVPQTIDPQGSYGCSFTAQVNGNAGDSEIDTVTASGQDDDGASVEDRDTATVDITNVASAGINVTKTADPISVDEPGANVGFTVRVENPSGVDNVTINSLVDDIHGNLNGQGDCSVPQTIDPGSAYECAFTAFVTGNAGESETDTVTASGQDDDGTPVSDNDSATVTVNDVPSSIEVTKTANPTSLPEPGGSVTFDVSVANTSAVDAVTINSLVDDIHGDLNGQGTCSVPQTIQAGNVYQCSFQADVAGNAGDSETDTVTASGQDDDGNNLSDSDTATVEITNVPSAGINVTKTADPTSVDEPGGSVTFTVEIDNPSSVDAVTINSLTDDIHGDLSSRGTCSVPQTIQPGDTYTCSFDADVTGNAGDSETDTVTASGQDDDGTSVSDSDTATVTVTDVGSSIEVTKTANPTSLPEPGGPVTFDVSVANTGAVDSVTINSLIDDIHGDLNGQGDCSVSQTLAPGDTYSCSFTADVTGNAGDSETDTVTASGQDDDGNNLSDSDTATVEITNVPSAGINVTKTADPTSVDEPGGSVTFTVEIDNPSSVDAVTINSLTDDIHGDLSSRGTCSVPQTIQPGDTYTCSFDADVTGNAGDSETDTVTASGQDDDGAPVSDSDTATVTVTDVGSSIEVTKTADPASVDEPGGSVTFTVEIDNPSSVDAVTINSLVDDIHGDLSSRGTCSVPQTIQPGDTYTCSFDADVTGNAGDSETDTVTASGQDDDGAPVSDSDTATVTVTDVGSSIEVTKTAEPTSVVAPGGPVTFNVDVENTSPADTVTIDSLVDDIHGDLDGQGDCSVPQTLAPGGSYACSFTANVTGSAGEGETDTVTAQGTDDDGATVQDSDSATVTIEEAVADLAIEKTDLDDPVLGGETLTYTLEVRNDGPNDAYNVTVDDTLPNDVTLQSVGGSGWTCSGSTSIACDLDAASLGAGQSASPITIAVEVAPDFTGTLTNTATVSSDATDPNTGNNTAAEETTVATMRADLSVTKTDSPDPVLAGQQVVWTITVHNDGPGIAENARLEDFLPSGVTLESANASQGSCNGSVSCQLGNIDVGNDVTVTITATVNPDFTGSTLNNTAFVSSDSVDPNSGNDSDTEATAVNRQVDLVLTKSDSDDPAVAGEQLTYELTVTNNGPSTATDVEIEDTLPSGVTFASSPDCSGSGSTVTCDVGTLAPSVSATVSLTVSIDPGTSGSITNTAEATSSEPESTPGDNTATEETDIDREVDLAIVKTDSQDPAVAGTQLTYTLTVTNNGPSTATDVEIEDTLPSGVTFASSPDCSESAGTVTCEVGTLAPSASADATITVNLPPDLRGQIVNTAEATSAEPDTDTTNNTATEPTDVEGHVDLTLTKTDSQDPGVAGTQLTYTLTVTNNGPSTATHVTIEDTLPNGVTFASSPDCSAGGGSITCDIGTLAPSTSAGATITVNLPPDLRGRITNTAEATGTEPDDNPSDNTATEPTDVEGHVDLVIAKSDSVDPAVAGTQLTYTLTVTNNGPSTATDVEIEDTLPSGVTFASSPDCGAGGGTVTCNLGTLAPSTSADATLTVNIAPSTLGSIQNTATVGSDETEDVPGDNTTTETTTVEAESDLGVEKSDSEDPVTAGHDFSYTLEVTNAGPSTATNVVVTDDVPAGLTIQSASGSGWSCSTSGQTVTCERGSLLPGSSTITINVGVPASYLPDGATVTNTATIASDTDDPNGGNDSASEDTTIRTRADLSISKSDNPDPVIAGLPLNFTITVVNNGPSDAQNVEVTDDLPAQTAFQSVTTTMGSCSESGHTITCDLGTMASGGSAVISISVKVDSGYSGNTIENTAHVSSDTTDPNPGNDDDTETTVTKRADLDIGKMDNPDPVKAGNDLQWTITVENNGPSDAEDVQVTDDLPSGVSNVSITPSQGSCSGTMSLTCDLGTIPSQGGVTITVNATVNADFNGSNLTNTANVTSSTPDPITSNNSGSSVTTVSQVADLSLTKRDDPDPVEKGSQLTYTITVTNDGPSYARNVTVNDSLPDGVTLVSTSTSQGSGCSGSSNLDCDLGTLPDGASATITIVVNVDTDASSTIANTASVSTTATDPNSGNNSAVVTTQVTEPEWDKASLNFTGQGKSCGNGTVFASIENTGDKPMQGTTAYELWYIASGDPKNGTKVAEGTIPALDGGASTTLTDDASQGNGVYKFKAYQRPGHPGQTEIWSEEINYDCN